MDTHLYSYLYNIYICIYIYMTYTYAFIFTYICTYTENRANEKYSIIHNLNNNGTKVPVFKANFFNEFVRTIVRTKLWHLSKDD